MALLKTRHGLTTTHQSQSAEILAALEAHPAFRAAHIVLLYYSLKDEVDTHEFVRKWSREKRILLPVVVGDDLELRVYTGPEDLTTGSYGIEEPTGELFTDYAAIDFVPAPHGFQSRHLFSFSIRERSACGAIRHPHGYDYNNSMKTNYHTHTTRCMHATGSDEDYVLSAIKGGYQELGFSDHTPWKYHTDYVADMRMLPEELPGYVESLRSLREKYRDQISIKIGLECEYFPAYIHWLKEKIKEYQLDYILFGNHHYHTDEKFPYFGHHTENLDMLELYEESAIEGMESGLFCCLAHPDLFMRSYPQFDRHCKLISRHICRTAARLHIPLEYNIGYVAYNEAHNLQTYPCPDFWHIAANEGCTAIIGLDAHNNKDLETPVYYNRAIEELKTLKIQRVDSLSLITNH